MNWLTQYHIEIGQTKVSLSSLLVALSVVLLGAALANRVAQRIKGAAQDVPPWRATTARILGYAIRVLSIVAALQVTGINLANVIAAGAVVAVGVGIALQKVAENFVSGVILLAERTIRVGDIVEVEGRIARVREMGIRATIVETLDNEEIIVPNGVLTQSAVKNLTLHERVCRVRIRVGVAYESDPDHVRETLTRAAAAISWRCPEPAPVIQLVEFAASSVDYDVSVWTSDVWGIRTKQSDLREAVWRAIRAANITIPFPQMDVHLDRQNSALLAVSSGDTRLSPFEAHVTRTARNSCTADVCVVQVALAHRG